MDLSLSLQEELLLKVLSPPDHCILFALISGQLKICAKTSVDVLVMTNHFTRLGQVFACRDQSDKQVAKVIWEEYFCIYGLPERIHSDQGPSFESVLIAELLQLSGVRKSHTTPYHPMANGSVECFKRRSSSSLATSIMSPCPPLCPPLNSMSPSPPETIKPWTYCKQTSRMHTPHLYSLPWEDLTTTWYTSCLCTNPCFSDSQL